MVPMKAASRRVTTVKVSITCKAADVSAAAMLTKKAICFASASRRMSQTDLGHSTSKAKITTEMTTKGSSIQNSLRSNVGAEPLAEAAATTVSVIIIIITMIKVVATALKKMAPIPPNIGWSLRPAFGAAGGIAAWSVLVIAIKNNRVILRSYCVIY